ncbi:GEVED domain-containing protein [Oceanihabitans sediminis]|uniref:GEVED domain-containing protein n=1 Tax=Oceanihabitans sediminis TaxID=1812012 RepID=UPI00299ED313|nr:GEVED domain-containing protein [Oceanihabitans sediminis]MDX1773123.1 GEVED domain-containing protein [Oceanihabitans sediminis]
MKKKYALIFLTFLCFGLIGYGQGLEDFTNSNATDNYSGNSFTGNNGITWTYVASRDENEDANSSGINGNALMLRRNSDDSKITSSTIPGGIGNFSVKLYKGFTGGGNREVELFINGVSQGTSTPFDDYNEHIYTVNNINIGGSIIIEIRNRTTKQVIIDDISWTGYIPCEAPADPLGTITGTTPACNTTTLNYTGAAAPGTINYWQSSPTGTSTANNATGTYTVTTSGTYYIRAFDTTENCWSTGNLSYDVTINNAPTITTQPTNATRTIPNTATFSVTATGSPTYQWQVSTDGGSTWTDVTTGTGGTTNAYTTEATSAGMNDNQYRCILTNSCGDTTSNAATLSLSNSSPNNVTGIRGCFQDNSVVLNWNVPSTGATPTGYIVFAIDGGTDPAGSKTDANTYTANSDFSAAATVSPASLGKVVYKGTATTATITGLTENNNYSFTTYAYVGESLTGWSNGGTAGSTVTNGLAQEDVRNLVATPNTNQVNLNWNNPTPTACFDELIIVANQGGPVTFTPSGNYAPINTSYTTPNSVVYATTGTVSSKAIDGLVNDVNACFKIFIRRGTIWSGGVEVCATPTLTYCTSAGSTSFRTGIRRVTFNTIDNATPIEYNDYSDFTATESTNVNLGEGYDLSVHVNTDGAYTLSTKVWIDWNQNGSFNDAGEEYDLGDAYDAPDVATTNSPLNIEVPIGATLGATRMRVSTKYGSYSTSCLNPFDGEVEDYTVVVQQPTGAEINVKGNNISIPSGFDSPYGLNNTKFATTNLGSSSAPKTYSIQNIGLADLNLTGTPIVEITGTNPGDFTVNMQPSTTTLSSNATSDFEITFTPLADGLRTAIVSISNNDTTGGENPYTFAVEGTGNCVTSVTSTIFPTEGPVGTEITVTAGTEDLTGATAQLNGVPLTVLSSSASELILELPNGVTDGNLVVTLTTGCSSINAFDVLDTSITGCETGTSATTPSDIFISEVTDATSGSSSYVEIYNGTGASIDLADYALKIYNNGNAFSSNTLTLAGILANNAVHVVSIGTTSCSLNNLTVSPDQVFSSVGGVNFDSNKADAIILQKTSGANQGEKDAFGVKGSGTWANGLSFGSDGVNFRRKNDAPILPTTTFDVTHWDIIDWTSCADSDYVDVGVYDFSLGIPPTITLQPAPPTSNCDLTATLSVEATEGIAAGLALAYQWYYLAPMQTTWTVISDNATFSGATTANLNILNTLNTIDYQFYCQVREDSNTCYTASNAVKLNLARTVWDGTNWTNATPPDINTIAIINGNYNTSSNGNFDACNLIINAGNTLTIGDGDYVNVNFSVTNNGTFNIQNNGSLVQIDDASINTGNISMLRNTQIRRLDYVYWSSPVSGFNVNNISPGSPTNLIFKWGPTDTNANGTQGNWINAAGEIMEPGLGYIVRGPNSYNNTAALYTAEFNNGVPFNGLITRNVSRGDSAANEDDDWNLLGNPYPSAINALEFLDNTVNTAALDGFVNIWTHGTLPSSAIPDPFYEDFVYNYTSNDYITYNGTGTTSGPSGFNGYIAAGQSFMVNMNNGPATTLPVEFRNNMRDKSYDNAQFYRNASMEKHRIWIDLAPENQPASRILVGYVENATQERDRLYDAITDTQNFYSLINDERFVIQGRALPFQDTDVVPIGVKIATAGNYTLAIAYVDGLFETENQNIYIKDNHLGYIHNISISPYSFSTEAGLFNDRFEIVYRENPLSMEENELNTGLTIIELQDGDVQFQVANNLEIKNVKIYDVLGRLLYNLQGNNSTEVYNLNKLSQSTYIAKITLSNGIVISKKAVKR